MAPLAESLIAALQMLERDEACGPLATGARHPELDEGQKLMLDEAWRRIDQVLTELDNDSYGDVCADDDEELSDDPEPREGAA